MIYELSRDYARAWDLIQKGEKLACWVDCSARPDRCTTVVSNNDDCLFFLEPSIFDDWKEKILNLSHFERFKKRCIERNTEFYLPLADNMIVVSEDRLREMLSAAIDKALAPMDKLIKSMGDLTNGNQKSSTQERSH
jgi:hypothetical protein